MITYSIISPEPPFFEVNVHTKEKAIYVCSMENINYFYEVDTSNPFEPINIWHIGKDGNLYSESWAAAVVKHDKKTAP